MDRLHTLLAPRFCMLFRGNAFPRVCALIIYLSQSFITLSNSSTSGVVVLCVDLIGGVGGVGQSRTEIGENAFWWFRGGGFVVWRIIVKMSSVRALNPMDHTKKI